MRVVVFVVFSFLKSFGKLLHVETRCQFYCPDVQGQTEFSAFTWTQFALIKISWALTLAFKWDQDSWGNFSHGNVTRGFTSDHLMSLSMWTTSLGFLLYLEEWNVAGFCSSSVCLESIYRGNPNSKWDGKLLKRWNNAHWFCSNRAIRNFCSSHCQYY